MPEIAYSSWIARGLAMALLADACQPGAREISALRARAAAALGENPAWLLTLLEPLALLSAASWQKFDLVSLAQWLEDSSAFEQAFAEGKWPRIRRLILRSPEMRPRPLGLDQCNLPVLRTLEELAAYLDLPLQQLIWLSPATPLGAEHYLYKLQPKRTGGLRLLEVPKQQLKKAQRALLDGLLNQVPVHEAAHGFTAGRSVASHAAAHVGKAVVIRFDLQDFFGSVTAAQVRAVWRTLGYPEGVARCLTALCTHRTADMVVERLLDDGGLSWMGGKRLRAAHLPQGAPTSPALANLCAFRLDLRLEGLAWVFGATYTRYADDLVFSGPQALRQQFRALQAWVAAIADDEGFALHPDKTRCLPQNLQQRVTGVVVNSHPNLPRQDFDRLKAALYQCVQSGPASQNKACLPDFKSHLLGRIAWVRQLNPARAAKLMRLFERIQW
ncbi:MAG: reverse transcriptase family protein [Pseudomonadota bacterium]